MKRHQIYAVYRGEKNLGDGTAEELEKKLAISKKKIYALCSPYVHKRDKGQQLVVIKLGKEEV
ncbi:hypothetical protein NM952_10905 [Pasteurella multocida subsp. multocida]|uniref:Uncharacterized protein n=1 Tax=Pasteurella multocida TaxID=747 RepID=A0A9X3ZLW7_PASMD|nr:hypothetical protein [Pasteurella multocida]MDA5619099.1 hypothetical protein [Pasteurella multocida subsp. multocida]MDA5621579.1 hypothetical protein [Pasteurella multocida subsp. multocida]MDA5624079.1 hypothetical protein [Pasteurella multocida]ODS43414.1 hypothetical protein BGK37_11235 [Pasteurella multocida]